MFIVGLEDGLFPYEREDDNENNKEEERRLMYVALTRAQKKVFLSYSYGFIILLNTPMFRMEWGIGVRKLSIFK